MPARWIVGYLDVIKDIRPGLRTSPIDLAGNAFGFQRREEAFHRRVIPNLPGPAHAAGDAMLVKQLPKVFAGVLGAFNRSSQHRIVEQILDARPGLQPVFSSQVFFEVSN